MGYPSWAEIYTFVPDNARWDHVTQLWIYYEGYGRKCQEKTDFLDSINSQHDLWRAYKEPVEKTEVISSKDWIRLMDPEKVQFRAHVEQRTIIENDDGSEDYCDYGQKLVQIERPDRYSVDFYQMLMDYLLIANTKELKEGFFDLGGVGRKWGEKEELGNSFYRIFEEIDEELKENHLYKIIIKGHGIKDYPRAHYIMIRSGYISYNWSRIQELNEQGIPPRRPSASSKNMTNHVTWGEDGEEQERDLQEMIKKIDKIISFQ
jgi:hypothetical protein